MGRQKAAGSRQPPTCSLFCKEGPGSRQQDAGRRRQAAPPTCSLLCKEGQQQGDGSRFVAQVEGRLELTCVLQKVYLNLRTQCTEEMGGDEAGVMKFCPGPKASWRQCRRRLSAPVVGWAALLEKLATSTPLPVASQQGARQSNWFAGGEVQDPIATCLAQAVHSRRLQ